MLSDVKIVGRLSALPHGFRSIRIGRRIQVRPFAPLVLLLIPLTAIGQNTPAGSRPSAASPAPAQQPPASVTTSPPAASQPAAGGNATLSSAHATPTPAGSATIIFYRPKRFMDSTFKPSVYVDDSTIGRLGNGENFKVKVTAGQHKLYSNDKSTGTDLDAKAGETYYIRIDMKTGITARGAVTQIDKQEGEFEVTKTKQTVDVDLTHPPGPPPSPLGPPPTGPPLGPGLPPPPPQP